MTPDICPNCGEVVPPKSKACPECGADEKTGWSDAAVADNLGIPSEDFDNNDYLKREFEGENPKRKNAALWIITAVILLAIFGYTFLR